MKKFSQTTLTLSQKQSISNYTKNLINTIFTDNICDKEHLLSSIIIFTKNNACSEGILTQTLLKGCFPRTTWSKGLMFNKTQTSSKIEISHPKEVSDVRFLTELNIADKFANISPLIKKVVFNSENPKHAIATTSYGNMYKDVSINCAFPDQYFNFTADIKSGNNAFEAFKGLIGVLPVTDNFQPYVAINTNPLTLPHLQEARLDYLKQCSVNDNLGIKFDKHIANIEGIMQTSFDPIIMNNLIQDELFRCIALNVLNKQPSFFASHKVSVAVFHEKFFKQLEPHINSSIFDNKENFNKFMSKAIRIYNDNIHEIYKNVKNDFWKGTGFENIADDVFK